ncbi:site-specific integrase [Halorubrum sp. Hd13]|uniref:tyrosine-type recombinase/integrase n=1 Tax=Halorubrum sp. Hd13 TaxID=1480728 RepID=UPI000B97DF29|nr:site-specific integrase [Halorubrum sp. Hd13]OYR39590.1 integrase [Halorubrum sp. Hd13]
MELEPIDPETALELYIAEKETSVADATVVSHKSRLSFLLRWCEEREIENLNELTGRRLQEFRLWRRNVGDLTKVSEKTQMDTLRVFVKWLESIDAVEQNLHKNVLSPDITSQENSRDVMLETDDAEAMLAYLERYEYASINHVTATLLWHTMLRMGSVRALDVEDYDPEEQSLRLRHRPSTDTPLKNKQEGERIIAVSGEVCLVLDDWIREQRPEVTDDHGRNPLLTTRNGRVAKTTLRTYCYQMTRPCEYGQECPHDRDTADCEALETGGASKCPSSVSPHPFRRGAITHYLQSDVPETVVGDRANVTSDVIDQHYDQRSQKEKMEQRRGYLDDI